MFSQSAKLLQFNIASFFIQILPQNLVIKKISVKNLMHPFYFGIQKYKGQRPVCLPKPTYLPIVWSVDFYIEDYLLILKKYMLFLKEQGRMQDLNSFFIIYHSAYRTYYTAAQRFKRSLQFSYVQILIRFWCDKFFPFNFLLLLFGFGVLCFYYLFVWVF